MSKVYCEIYRKTAKYYKEDGMEITKKEYVETKISEAEAVYEEVVLKAKENGRIWCAWIQRTFNLDWYGSSHIIERMRDEGICEEFNPNLKDSQIIIYAA